MSLSTVLWIILGVVVAFVAFCAALIHFDDEPNRDSTHRTPRRSWFGKS